MVSRDWKADALNEGHELEFVGDVWANYRKNNSSSYIVMNFDLPGLESFWIKFRRPGTFTSVELHGLEGYWNRKRMAYLATLVEEDVQDSIEESKEKNEIVISLEEALDLVSMVTSDEEKLEQLSPLMRARVNAVMERTAFNTQLMFSGMDIAIIEEWNLTDPVTGGPLPLPKEDLTTFEKLPMEVLTHIRELLVQVVQMTYPPKVSTTNTSPSSETQSQ